MTTELYNIFLRSKGVSIDTREDLKGKIFFALPGKNVDSNTFYKRAFEKGAIACVVSDKSLKEIANCYYFEDTLVALQQLAIRYRKDFMIPVVGITGSNGKTTTKEILYSILKNQFRTHATAGNYNNHIGLPLTILSAPQDTEVLILEMGANAPGEIKTLCEQGQPTHGLITSIGRAHLEGFGDLNGVIKTKFELFEFLDRSGGHLFINLMDNNIRENRKLAKHDILINENEFAEAKVNYKVEELNPFVIFKIKSAEDEIQINSRLTGKHNWMNILNAMAVSFTLGVDLNNIKLGIENYIPQNSRSQWVKYHNSLILLDAYNANPSSVKSMFSDFDAMNSKRPKIAILGEMAELGNEKLQAHNELVKMLKNSKTVHKFFLVGKIFEGLEGLDTDQVFTSASHLKENLPADFYDENNLIMIKGSRSVKLEELFDSSNFESFDSFE